MKPWQALATLLLVGCAGFERDCAASCNDSLGADWIVVQYGFDGAPINCWEMRSTAISNESQTDGIYWRETSGHMVHISGWYNRVQVTNNDWDGAARALGIDDARCKDGKYLGAGEKK